MKNVLPLCIIIYGHQYYHNCFYIQYNIAIVLLKCGITG